MTSTLLLGGCDRYHFEEELYTTLSYDTVAVTTRATPKPTGGNRYISDPDTNYHVQITGFANPDHDFISDSDDKVSQLLGDYDARTLYHTLHESDSAIVDRSELIEKTYKNGVLTKEEIKKRKFIFRPHVSEKHSQ